METLPEITYFALQLIVVGCIELIAMGIEKWQEEPTVPTLVKQLALPPFLSRVLFFTAYLCIVVVFSVV